jgi:hypothetical protein
MAKPKLHSAFLQFYTWCKNWLKAMVKLAKLLPRRQGEEESDPAPGVLTPLDKELGRRIQERQAGGRVITTGQGGPNMPKHQFCACGRRAKRTDKAQIAGREGAFYNCSIHGEFFVGK